MGRAGECIAFTAPPVLFSMGATSVVLVPPPHPDGALLAMAAELRTLDASGIASPRWKDLFTAIGQVDAVTIDGVRAKAWAASLVVELDDAGRPIGPEQNLIWTLCRDIARIA